ncbi:hypothetical protein BH24CHL6_BH24CHL6_08690 [soil metagenome]
MTNKPIVRVDEREGIAIHAPLDVADADLEEAAKSALRLARHVVAARRAKETGERQRGVLSRPDYADMMGRWAYDLRAGGLTWKAIAQDLLHRDVDLDDVRQVKRWASRWRAQDPADVYEAEVRARQEDTAGEN